ncbi:MAG: histidine kinase, partial [Pseudoalteromonas shioyasakiensis]
FLAHAIQKLGGKVGGAIMRAWGFTDEFVEVAESWANPNYRPEHICYVDFIRIGAILEGILQVSDKSAALQTYMDKGVIESLDMFSDDEYHDMLNEVKAIFTE